MCLLTKTAAPFVARVDDCEISMSEVPEYPLDYRSVLPSVPGRFHAHAPGAIRQPCIAGTMALMG